MTPDVTYNNVSCARLTPGEDGRVDVRPWLLWGRGIEVLTRPLCGACAALKRRLRRAGIPFREWSHGALDGLAVWAYYDAPAVAPAVAIDGRLIEGSGDADQLFAEVLRHQEGKRCLGSC